jgi:predicted RNA-binding Zn ribbon-like protein
MGNRRAPQSLALVQDLVNTWDIEDDRDSLAGPDAPDGLAEFVAAHGLHDMGLTAADLPALRDLREALRAACLTHAGCELPEATSRKLDAMLADAPLVLAVTADGDARLRPAPGLAGAALFTSRIAADIAAAAADGSWQRLKACEAEDCLWAFYDRSPAGRGRWCSMQLCGSRAKMRTYRARRRTGGPQSPDGLV